MYPYGPKEDLIVRLELNSSEKIILCTRDTSATYKLLDISLEYVAIFDQPYATSIGELYTGTTSVPYTKVTSIRYQTLSKKHTTWKIDVNNLSVRLLQGLLLLLMVCLINSLRLDCRRRKFIQSLKNIFIRKTLM